MPQRSESTTMHINTSFNLGKIFTPKKSINSLY